MGGVWVGSKKKQGQPGRGSNGQRCGTGKSPYHTVLVMEQREAKLTTAGSWCWEEEGNQVKQHLASQRGISGLL